MNQKGFVQLVILSVVIIGLVIGIFLVKEVTDIAPDAKMPIQSQPIQATSNQNDQYPPIENENDLLDSLSVLEKEDIDSLGQITSENESDAASF